MLAHLRRFSASTTRSFRATYSRQISCTSVRNAEELAESSQAGEQVQEQPTSSAFTDPSYETWLQGPGRQFKDPHRPRNWLGGQVVEYLSSSIVFSPDTSLQPFPLNPTFKPPTPVSDELRTLIYTQYMANPAGNGVRALASRYGLSMKRVDAILRLKGLEAHWQKVRVIVLK